MLLLYYLSSAFWLSIDINGAAAAILNTRQGTGSYYAITGPTGGVHSRLEIRELQHMGPMWNIFLLALVEFEAIDQSETDSYYQIAALTPFHKTASGEWWTSANSRNIADLGYTYPELADNPSNETLISRINALYRDSDLAATSMKLNASTKDIEYIVQVEMPTTGSFSYNVVLFLGEVGDDPSKWLSEDSFVSKTSSLGVVAAQGSTSTLGMIVLTDIVKTRIAKNDVQQTQVVKYLITNLKWRLELGEEISRSYVPGVKVTLMSTKVERATSAAEIDRWVGGFDLLGDIDA
ncbi:hypothetical protein N0V90_004131 [Kalmusia sp. IMI 367209]|nr:hypothetical protein N0V90_004131 [Kalmusia sp. IMI 367209]